MHQILAIIAATLAAPSTVLADDPPIRLMMADEVYVTGQRAQVSVRLVSDGYLVVLRINAQGRVRVLFPIDPSDSSVTLGGKEFAIVDRGGREGFVVDDQDGSGMVIAARADTPFDFQEFTRGVHWDWRALSTRDSGSVGETALVDVVDRMATSDYEYDILPYSVRGNRSSAHGGRYNTGYHPPTRHWYIGRRR